MTYIWLYVLLFHTFKCSLSIIIDSKSINMDVRPRCLNMSSILKELDIRNWHVFYTDQEYWVYACITVPNNWAVWQFISLNSNDYPFIFSIYCDCNCVFNLPLNVFPLSRSLGVCCYDYLSWFTQFLDFPTWWR